MKKKDNRPKKTKGQSTPDVLSGKAARKLLGVQDVELPEDVANDISKIADNSDKPVKHYEPPKDKSKVLRGCGHVNQPAPAVEDDDAYCDYLMAVTDQVFDEINAGHFDLDPAFIGFDQYSSARIYSYKKIIDILMANGYCWRCADAFAFNYSMMPGEQDKKTGEYKMANIIVLEKDDNSIVGFENKYWEWVEKHNGGRENRHGSK